MAPVSKTKLPRSFGRKTPPEKTRNSRIMHLDGVRLHRLRLGDDLLQHAHHLLEALILLGSRPREERAHRILASPREKTISTAARARIADPARPGRLLVLLEA